MNYRKLGRDALVGHAEQLATRNAELFTQVELLKRQVNDLTAQQTPGYDTLERAINHLAKHPRTNATALQHLMLAREQSARVRGKLEVLEAVHSRGEDVGTALYDLRKEVDAS